MKKFLSVILCVSIMLSGLTAFSSASVFSCGGAEDETCPLSVTITPEKSVYEKGEEIKISTVLYNQSYSVLSGVTYWMDYSESDSLLTPGVTEHTMSSLSAFAEEENTFSIAEDDTVVEIASAFTDFPCIYSFLQKLAHFYKNLTLAYVKLKSVFTDKAFVSLNKEEAELGTVTVIYDGQEITCTLKCSYTVDSEPSTYPVILSSESGLVSADVKAVGGEYTGLCFNGIYGDTFTGYQLLMAPSENNIYLVRSDEDKLTFIGKKSAQIDDGSVHTLYAYASDGVIKCWLDDMSSSPVFDISADTFDYSGSGAVVTSEDDYSNFFVSGYDISISGETYCNPVYDNAPDPYILYDDGTYYLYATTSAGEGFRVSTSEDLVNWQDNGFCARKPDIYGSYNFWAPEVYKYNGKYYLLYSAEEHLCLAVSDSPCGPFKKTSDSYLIPDHAIDGDIFFDDDGRIYLFMAYWDDNGEEIYGCELNGDLLSVKDGTLTKLINIGDNEQGVNEGPFMLKHNGKYYLTYSVNGYTDRGYRVDCAVSSSPLSGFEKQGTILERAGGLVGTGHHSFTVSPDGTELIIAYHCHYSATQVHARKLCIDRAAFVTQADGTEKLTVYGPTSTAQPYPSSGN